MIKAEKYKKQSRITEGMNTRNNSDEIYMREAILEAKKAALRGEVPIGSVIVYNGKIISRAGNARETEKNAVRHAEITAIEAACEYLGGWRLSGCTLYVTLEPCPMCAGAIINSRIDRVVYGIKDAKTGAFGSVLSMDSYPLNHKPEICIGVLEDECREVLGTFFGELRKREREEKAEKIEKI